MASRLVALEMLLDAVDLRYTVRSTDGYLKVPQSEVQKGSYLGKEMGTLPPFRAAERYIYPCPMVVVNWGRSQSTAIPHMANKMA